LFSLFMEMGLSLVFTENTSDWNIFLRNKSYRIETLNSSLIQDEF